MNIETMLNAYMKAVSDPQMDYDIRHLSKRLRQARAFRARILRMDQEQRMDLAQARMELEVTKQSMSYYLTEKDAEIERLHGRVTENILFIVRRDAIIREKDDEIRVLKKYIKDHGYKRL